MLVETAQNVCLQLQLKDVRWEQFLMGKEHQRCKRFMKLQLMIQDYIKEHTSHTATTRGQTTQPSHGTSLMEEHEYIDSQSDRFQPAQSTVNKFRQISSSSVKFQHGP